MGKLSFQLAKLVAQLLLLVHQTLYVKLRVRCGNSVLGGCLPRRSFHFQSGLAVCFQLSNCAFAFFVLLAQRLVCSQQLITLGSEIVVRFLLFGCRALTGLNLCQLGIKCFKLLVCGTEIVAQLAQCIWLVLGSFGCGHSIGLLFLLGFPGLGFCTAALNVTTGRRNSTTKHCATDETVDVFFACVFVCKVCACLQAFEHLLNSFGKTFPCHGRAGLEGIVRDRFAQRLVGDSFGLLGCQLGAYGTKQLAHTGDQRHGGSINQCLWDGSAKGCGSAGFFQRLACLHLSGKVGACELTRRHSACAQQAQASSNRGRYWSGQSRKTCGCRSRHIGDRPAKGLFKLLER